MSSENPDTWTVYPEDIESIEGDVADGTLRITLKKGWTKIGSAVSVDLITDRGTRITTGPGELYIGKEIRDE